MDGCQSFYEVNYSDNDKLNIMHIRTGKVTNQIHRAGKIKEAARAEWDCYVSMNPLTVKDKVIRRDKEHVGRLKWLYVDLDHYRSAYSNHTIDQVIGLLELDHFDQRIPWPNYIVDSGRGLYLLWRLDEHIKAYPRWLRMQKFLCDQLEEFGADAKVSADSARVLRKIGSINSKTGREVKIISQKEHKYSLTNLLREYVDEAPSEKMIKYAKHIADVLEIGLPDMKDRAAVKDFIRKNKEPANLFWQMQKSQKAVKRKKSKITYINTEYSLLRLRLKDLEKLLITYRDQDHGCREYILFLYRYWTLCISDDKDQGLQKTLELNNRLCHPLSEKEVICATKSAEKYFDAGKIYRCTNEHIIRVLGISEEEMKELKVFINDSERSDRKKIRNKKDYKKLLKKEGKLTKQEEIHRRRQKIYKLLKGGAEGHEICKKLKISRATFYADKQHVERILAAEKKKKEEISSKLNEWKEEQDIKCLKFSAFELYMSFRTCALVALPGLSLWCRSFFESFLLSAGCSRPPVRAGCTYYRLV